MSASVTARAERDEILFGIISQVVTPADVADLKILRGAAVLAALPIACKPSPESSRYAAGSSFSRDRFGLNRFEAVPHEFQRMQFLPKGNGADYSLRCGGCAVSVGRRCRGSTLRITFKGSCSLKLYLIYACSIGAPGP